MRYAKIREMDVSNGEGVGASLFVQGCHFHCKGCFNPETWDFNGGKEYTDEVHAKFMDIVGREHIKRVSILGGEPLANENVAKVLEIVSDIKNRYPSKKIWVYTGSELNEILKPVLLDDLGYDLCSFEQSCRFSVLRKIDTLVDGRFEIDKQDLFNEHIVFAGSTNQRVIDIQPLLKSIDAVHKYIYKRR